MSCGFWVARLNAQDAAVVWPKVTDILEAAVSQSSGLWTPEDLYERVTRADAGTPDGWALWIICEGDRVLGSWVTKAQPFPRERILEIVFAGGADMARWYDQALSETEKYASEIGCRRLRGYGRRGWLKFGYCGIGYVFERMIAP